MLWSVAVALAAEPVVTSRMPTHFAGRMFDDGAHGVDDLDGDGHPERWTVEAGSGSGFGGSSLVVTPGTGGDALVFDLEGSFGDFVTPSQSPPGASLALTQGVARLLLGRGQQRVLDPKSRDAIDASFRWLLDRDARQDADPRPFFVESGSFDVTWVPGAPALPDSQYVVASTAPTAKVQGPPWIIAYYAHNHHTLVPMRACGADELWRTDHALVLYDRAHKRHRWVWIGTHLQKLRWPSLSDAVCAGGLVIADVDPHDTGRTVVVLDPATGRWGLLEPNPSSFAWVVKGGALVRGDERWTLADLKIAVNPAP